ncbi:MAG: 6-phosphofructokinase, partial [Bacteroidota bacterium]
PEIVAESIRNRGRRGRKFSIVAVAEGCYSKAEVQKAKKKGIELAKRESRTCGTGCIVATELGQMTGIETRETVLGYIQRGGTPTAADRILATRVGTRAAELIAQGKTGYMVAMRGGKCKALPLEDVAGKRNEVPTDHPMIESARLMGICMGDQV